MARERPRQRRRRAPEGVGPLKLFDTTILIAYLRGIPAARALLNAAAFRREAHASVLSRVEIDGGMRSHERPGVGQLLSVLILEPVTNIVAVRAGEFLRAHRRSHSGIETIDYVIAATADVMGAELVTLNVRHFPMFQGLRPAF